jgi:hypothetical protein
MPSVNDNQPNAPQQEGTHKDAKRIGSVVKSNNIRNNGNIHGKQLHF